MYSKYKLVLLISVWKDHSLVYYKFKAGARPDILKWVGLHKIGWAKRKVLYESCTPNYGK